MELSHDSEADAIYIKLNKKHYSYSKELDDERHVDYASDGSPIGVELLCVSMGVNIEGLPCKEEIRDMLAKKKIRAFEFKWQPRLLTLNDTYLMEVDFSVSRLINEYAPATV